MEAEKGSKFKQLKQKFTDKVRQVRSLGLSDLGDEKGLGGIFVPDDPIDAPLVNRAPDKEKKGKIGK